MKATPRLAVLVLASFLAGGIVPQAGQASLSMLNLTGTDWREVQFSDTSCVRREVGRAVGCVAAPGKQNAHSAEPRQDIHFTPGNPFGVIAGLKLYF